MRNLTEEKQLDRLEEIINQVLVEKVYIKHASGKVIEMDKFLLN